MDLINLWKITYVVSNKTWVQIMEYLPLLHSCFPGLRQGITMRVFFSFFIFEIKSHYFAQAGLKLTSQVARASGICLCA
jgi:hypothetical protein